ncbi:MAG: hypothetical protein ACOX0X_02620 [Candidatus Dojkabacteria bacterium]|jgi:hypothetical protein
MDTASQNIASVAQNSEDILQDKLDSFAKELRNLNLSEEQIQTVASSLVTTATKQVMAKISSLMDDKEFNNWKKFVDTGANTAQQLIVLNRLLINKTGKDLNTLHEQIIDDLIKNTLGDIASVRDLNLKVSKLSDEEVAKAQELLKQGDFDSADKVINKED